MWRPDFDEAAAAFKKALCKSPKTARTKRSENDVNSEYETLVKAAEEAMENAYAPYSGFCVGAALKAKNGRVYTGCNIENAAFTPTNCAERTAFFKAISEGERLFEAIAIVGGKNGEVQNLCPPCGVCRQVMREFCKADFKIVLKDSCGVRVFTLGELLPLSFSPDQLG